MSDSIEQTPCELIFDLDGTLTDPALGFVRSVNFSLKSHGTSPVEEDDLKKFIGPPLDGAFREILHLDQDKDVSSFVSKYRERYSEVGFSENILYDGIPDVLVTLRRLGFRLGVCTSKRVDFASQRKRFQKFDTSGINPSTKEKIKIYFRNFSDGKTKKRHI